MKNKIIDLSEIESMDRIYRINLINSVTGFKSANLIGTQNEYGLSNLAIFSSVIHLGSNPPLLGFISRPAVIPRHTYSNIKHSGYYTINHVHTDIVERSHKTSAKFYDTISEFDECNFTPEFSDKISAPYVQEANIKLGMKFIDEYEIKENGTILIIGKIEEIILNEAVLKDDGFVDLQEAGTVTISGLDSYHSTDKIHRFGYARPFAEILKKW
ncbi:MAG: flavin reductase [Chitinophagales bacterium]|nr:flavin reductase [Chitinophagales bacterium]